MRNQLTIADLSFETKTDPLNFVLTAYQNEFFAFLLNGPKKELTRERMKEAIDLFFDIRFKGDGIKKKDAQFEINDQTQSGLQNLTVVRFFAEFLK